MVDTTEKLVEIATAEIERQTEILSQQPRFKGGHAAFGTFLRWLQSDEIGQAPPYTADSRKRDAWLRAVWRQEPHLAGVINSVVLIDANRGWTLVGGRNQVARYTDILHDAEAGEGWRTYMRKAALSYWCTDLGCITEVGRDGANGPLRAIYHVDSARCRLTGDIEMPLEYFPASGGMQRWGARDFYRVASTPSDDEAMCGLGFCAVSRCLEVIRLLYAVMMHDQEQVGTRAPRGLLLLQGISEQQWLDSLAVREEEQDSLERRYYGGVQVLASAGMDQIDAKLVGLSQLPVNFDARQFMDLSMYAIALCFGYDPSEFWPVQYGALGRGTETEIQHAKATGKGGLDFALHFQERLQDELPETLHFEFEQRDDQGELLTASLAKAKQDVITAAYQAGLMEGAPLISRDEARSLLVEARLIPQEWTEAEEEVQATDTEDASRSTEFWRDRPEIRRMMELMPKEEIVTYTWPDEKFQTIWRPGQRRVFRTAVIKREWDRFDVEGELLHDLEGLFEEAHGEIVEAVEGGGDPERALAALGIALASILFTRFLTQATDILSIEISRLGIPVDFDMFMTDVQLWAQERAEAISKEIVETTRKRIADLAAGIAAGTLALADFGLAILPWFGEARAEGIAITEITALITAVQVIYYQLLQKQGQKLTLFWVTAQDERVCAICGALEGQPEEVWRRAAPLGPPVHPRCRCWLISKPAEKS